jgi:maltose O-acetyltransferase
MGHHLRSITTSVASKRGIPTGLRRRLFAFGGIAVGSGATIRSGSTFSGSAGVSIGADCYIGYQCDFNRAASITIHDNVYIAHRVSIVTATHAIGDSVRRASSPQLRRPVTIRRGCWLGAGSMILPGVTVGEGCVIAAGAVVTADCARDGLFAGVPARRVRDLSSG